MSFTFFLILVRRHQKVYLLESGIDCAPADVIVAKLFANAYLKCVCFSFLTYDGDLSVCVHVLVQNVHALKTCVCMFTSEPLKMHSHPPRQSRSRPAEGF